MDKSAANTNEIEDKTKASPFTLTSLSKMEQRWDESDGKGSNTALKGKDGLGHWARSVRADSAIVGAWLEDDSSPVPVVVVDLSGSLVLPLRRPQLRALLEGLCASPVSATASSSENGEFDSETNALLMALPQNARLKVRDALRRARRYSCAPAPTHARHRPVRVLWALSQSHARELSVPARYILEDYARGNRRAHSSLEPQEEGKEGDGETEEEEGLANGMSSFFFGRGDVENNAGKEVGDTKRPAKGADSGQWPYPPSHLGFVIAAPVPVATAIKCHPFVSAVVSAPAGLAHIQGLLACGGSSRGNAGDSGSSLSAAPLLLLPGGAGGLDATAWAVETGAAVAVPTHLLAAAMAVTGNASGTSGFSRSLIGCILVLVVREVWGLFTL